MVGKRTLLRALELTALAVVFSLLVGQLVGQPVLLAFVETGSMSPTMESGDGFVAIPAQLAGPVETGDVVTYRAEAIQGGGLTTHRVVAQTEGGYVTRGDANPFTDQESAEPPVKDAQVVAVAWRPGGQVFVVPKLGMVVQTLKGALDGVQRTLSALFGTRALLGTRGFAYLMLGTTVLYYIVGEYRDSGGRKTTKRSRTRDSGFDVRIIVLALSLLLVASATAAMVGPSGQQQYDVVSAEFESAQPTVIPAGESTVVQHPLGNGGIVPVLAYVEPAGEGVEVTPNRFLLAPRETANATLTLQAPPETGYYRRYVGEHHYLVLLPTQLIHSLYEIHPWAPIVAIDALVGVPFFIIGVKLAGSGRIRNRSRGRDLPTLTRLRRLIRGLT